MSSIRITSLGLMAVLALGIAACTPQDPDITEEEQVGADQRPEPQTDDGEDNGDGEAGGDVFTFVAEDIEFTDAPTEVTAGTVTFELINDGGATHNVVIDETGENVVEADGGETATGTVDLEPGEYNYHCDIPGHQDLMNGTFTVS